MKDKTVELMQTSVRGRSEELKHIKDSLPEHVYAHRKKSIAETLRRMMPAGTSEIAAMKADTGRIVTSTTDLAKMLNEHWQDVFARKNTDRELRRRWLERIRDKSRVLEERLRPTRTIVETAIRGAAPSSSGPDGIPFEVYKLMGDPAVELFLELANSMLDQNDDPGEDFNLAYMVCISKGDEGTSVDGVPYCSPGGTRPISIVDAANRILASIFAATLEKEIGLHLHRAQKGFLRGRQMLRNVLEIDMAAQKISVRSKSGAILLFDFAAAFPSISHDMLWDVLDIAGIDSNVIEVVKMFYWNNRHLLKLHGSLFHGVVVHSGVDDGRIDWWHSSISQNLERKRGDGLRKTAANGRNMKMNSVTWAWGLPYFKSRLKRTCV